MKRSLRHIVLLVMLLMGVFVIHSYANPDNQSSFNPLNQTSTTLLDSNLFTQVDDKRIYDQPTIDLSEYKQVLENNQLVLYLNEDSLAIRVLNKLTGYIWTSDPTEEQYDDFNRTWLNRMQSAFHFEFMSQDDEGQLVLSTPWSLLDIRNRNVKYDVDLDNDRIDFDIDLKEVGIRFSYSITLLDTGLDFHFSTHSIEEYRQNNLASITFFPFLGAVKEDEIPGYLFIPSGSGGLVRYVESSNIRTPYRVRYYAQDLYYSGSAPELALNYPIYGVVHGIDQNAYFSRINSGAEYAEFTYLPPGYRTDYHMQYVTYKLRERYYRYIPGADEAIPVMEDLKLYDIKFTIHLLSNEEANYVGMAQHYKQTLIDEGILNQSTISDELELHLDMFGGDYEKGLIFKKKYSMTTTDQIREIHNELNEQAVDNIFYTLRGFNRGWHTEASYRNYQFNSKLGNIKDLKDLNVTYYYNPTTIHTDKLKAPRGSMKRINGQMAYDSIQNGEYYRFYADIDTVMNEFPKAKKTINTYGGMALDGLSYLFYSNENHQRHEMYDNYYNLLDEAIPMYRPNEVMLRYTSKYLTSPFQHERLRFITDSVPFIQIVLSGYVPYYSSFLNFSANMQIDVLRIIDYGANPAFLLTYEPSHLLSDTFSNEFYASYYGNLREFIADSYHYINDALKHVRGEAIVDREVLDLGIVRVEYSNGVEIYLNYSETDYPLDEVIIPAHDYLVRK